MRIAVVYASRTGNTRRAAENIATIVRARGHEVSVRSVDTLDFKELAEADLVIIGTWVSGHFVIAQKPGDAKRLAKIPQLTGKKVAIFMTYALNPGPALRRMETLFRRQGADVVGGLAWNRRKTEEGVSDYVDAILSAVGAPA